MSYWGAPPPPPVGFAGQPPPPQQQQQQQKHDIFVGNLAFNTTEEQLHQAFSEIGRVLKVRLVTDMETGKPRGFAFVEFEDPQVALSAIRNMNDHELNGRRIRVNFSNSSHLEELAGKLGMDLSAQTQKRQTGGGGGGSSNQSGAGGSNAVADALKGLSKGEMFDIVANLKEIADRDVDEARRIMSSHPQLPEALLFLMSKLDMVQTPITPGGGISLLPAATMAPASTARVVDPRARALDPRATKSDPRAAAPPAAPAAAVRADPRAKVDPRARAAASAPPPPPPPQGHIPPPPPPPKAGGVVQNLDPALIQQVMSLTPLQISQLPPDKQQSIMALRQQIQTGTQ